MHTTIISRHLVNNEETLEELLLHISQFYTAPMIAKQKGYDFSFGLKLTVYPKASADVRTKAHRALSYLPKDSMLFYDAECHGPGTSLSQVLFNPAFFMPPSFVVNADLDQFVLDTPEALDAVYALVQNVEKKGALLGIGARDVPVVLARDACNSRLRIVHEMFQTLAIGPDVLSVPEKKESVTPAYAALGDFGSGFYVMNTLHPMYPTLLQSVAHASQVAAMNEVAIDFFVVRKVAQYGTIVADYVHCQENKFYGAMDPCEELKWVHSLVTEQTKVFGKTDVGPGLWDVVMEAQSSTIDTIAKFYPRDVVKTVQCWMYDALHNR